MGHEAIGVVVDVGPDVQRIKRGQVVIMPFAYSDGTCMFCEEGLHTACVQRGFFGNGTGLDGAQAEALRVPNADGTLYPLEVGEDDALMPSLLTLSDVMGTGHHAAVTARVRRGGTVAVVGDGAVGLCGVIAAKRLGAEQIIIMGRHQQRIELAKRFGATDVVSERGEEAIERVRELTGGFGVQSVLECVGTGQAMDTSMGIVRAGGAVGRVGVPHYEAIAGAQPMFFNNVIVARRARADPRLHRRTAARHHGRPDRAWIGVRSDGRPRRRSRWLSRDERARGAQGDGEALTPARRRQRRASRGYVARRMRFEHGPMQSAAVECGASRQSREQRQRLAEERSTARAT